MVPVPPRRLAPQLLALPQLDPQVQQVQAQLLQVQQLLEQLLVFRLQPPLL
ncbi:MAG: hypothetical protein HN881_06675 [Porticoccaceae bacterium]|nr:hypothetical protein [Porticoccaceae bacterium]